MKFFIIENISKSDLTAEEIAANLLMSRVHLYRKIKALTGNSVTHYMRQVRLAEALPLLKAGKFNISEVAYKTGFSSPSHFARTFKKEMGQTPSEYLSKQF